jgi:ribosomal protein S18 acetylase RimI-like enzyme
MLADDTLGAAREVAPTDGADVAPEYVRAFTAIDANPDELLLVASLGGVVVGCLQLTLLHHLGNRGAIRAHIEGVRIASPMRGRGLGHQLLESALERARERGATIAQLSTDKRRTDARRFYESLGFRATHEGMKLPLGAH